MSRGNEMTTTMTKVAWFAALLLGAQAMATGCGGDDDDSSPPAAAGKGGSSGKAGAGGGAGTAGAGGNAGTVNVIGGSGGGLPEVCASDSECRGLTCCDKKDPTKPGEKGCVDKRVDILNCGACGTVCPGADKQQALCQNGACAACPAGTADCNVSSLDGCEATLATDPKNCGACGKACLLANSQDNTCDAGACKIGSCKGGFYDCDKDAANGCEVDSSNDPQHCGGCDKACPEAANAKATCELGQCGKFVCNPGFADCDGDASNGCEIDLLGDTSNCGKCGEACDAVNHGQAACVDGICSIGACDKGFDNCDGSTGNGCETDLAVDINHCGACAQKCSEASNSSGSCVGGFCSTGTCNPGYADCDPEALGCEVNLATDPKHCGSCDIVCPDVLNGAPKCEIFACGIGSCNDGYKHCLGGEEGGCETDIYNDLTNCGDCSNVCPTPPNATPACKQGSCGIDQCQGTFRNCDGQLDNGCEIDVAKDKDNCSDCGQPCPAPPNGTPKCDGGLCDVASCDAGYDNCDGIGENGCERPVLADASNCGKCGVVCGSGICENGKCVCSPNVLLIVDDSPAGAAPLIAAMQSVGLVVQVAKDGGGKEIPVWQYSGTPAPKSGDFGAVVVLSGGPTIDPSANSAISDMPAAGQQALVDFVKSSNGLVLTEWAAQHVANGRWQTLKDYVLLERTISYVGQVTYGVDPAFAAHPLWEGLPGSFKFSSTSNVGLTRLGSGNKRLAGSPEALDAVAIRDEPNQGRVAHVAHAGSYNDNGWSNANIARLVANAAAWAARCK